MTDIKQKLREIQSLVEKELPDALAFKPQGKMKNSPDAKPAPTVTPSGAPRKGRFHPSGVPATPAGAQSPSGQETVYQYSGNQAIKDMQKELITLSKTVTSQINVQDVAKGEGDREKGEAASRDSFGNFITKHYLRESDVPGVEFDPSAKVTQLSQKTPSTPTRLGVIMDTMNRIGGGAKEFAADGRWGGRTQAAVQNAYAFAYALLKLAKDFKLPVKSYTEGNLATLKELISSESGGELDNAAKITNAPRISIHLRAIVSLYNEIKAGVLEKPEYQAFIEGDKPFATYSKPGAPGAKLTPQQVASINAAFGNKLQVYSKPISINDLLTGDAFKKWVQTNVPQIPVDNVLATLKKQIATTIRDTGALAGRE